MSNRSYYTEQMLADEQFMQFPKWLMQDKEFSKLSNDAKVLYCLLKDRFKLSSKNHWIDKQGRVYVVCKRESMGKLLNRSKNTVTNIVNELIDNNLIEEEQKGLNKPNYIYLLMPEFSDSEDLEFDEDNYREEPYQDMENDAKIADKQRTPKIWDSRIPKNGTPNSQELGDISKNNSSKNKSSKLLNNNIDNTYESKPIVVEKDLIDYVNSVIYKSILFDTYVESGNTNSFINAAERVIKNVKNQSKNRKKALCYFDKGQILVLLNAALDVENDTYGTLNNPDGYVVSKINEEIEKLPKKREERAWKQRNNLLKNTS